METVKIPFRRLTRDVWSEVCSDLCSLFCNMQTAGNLQEIHLLDREDIFLECQMYLVTQQF